MFFKYKIKNNDKLNQEKLNKVLNMAKRLLENSTETNVRDHPIYGLIKVLINYQLYDLARNLCEGENVISIAKIYEDLGIWVDGFNTDDCINDDVEKMVELEIDLSTDIVLMCAWNEGRFANALVNIGANVENPFNFDKNNHFVSYIYPLGITLVDNGNHSLLTGVLKSEGVVYPIQTYDITGHYELVYFDGTYYREKNTDKIIHKVERFELGAVFEIGRLLAEKGIK
ncbi:MAG: hypothetical protein II977_01890 [Oscillospiraceae bacterium]|nr:hypothetical protein [Oscillospiraceae bacterium]